MPESDEKTCPYCAETIAKGRDICKYCGKTQLPASSVPLESTIPASQSALKSEAKPGLFSSLPPRGEKRCPYCSSIIEKAADVCRYCGGFQIEAPPSAIFPKPLPPPPSSKSPLPPAPKPPLVFKSPPLISTSSSKDKELGEANRRIGHLESNVKILIIVLLCIATIILIPVLYVGCEIYHASLEKERESEFFSLDRKFRDPNYQGALWEKKRYLKLLHQRHSPSIELSSKRIIRDIRDNSIEKVDTDTRTIWVNRKFWTSKLAPKYAKSEFVSDTGSYFANMFKNEIPYCTIRASEDDAVLAEMRGYYFEQIFE